jgi:hypothetical protein
MSGPMGPNFIFMWVRYFFMTIFYPHENYVTLLWYCYVLSWQYFHGGTNTFSWRFLTHTNYFCGDNTATKIMFPQTWRSPNFCAGHHDEKGSWRSTSTKNVISLTFDSWGSLHDGYLYFYGVYFLFSFTFMKCLFSSSSVHFQTLWRNKTHGASSFRFLRSADWKGRWSKSHLKVLLHKKYSCTSKVFFCWQIIIGPACAISHTSWLPTSLQPSSTWNWYF